MVETDTGAVFGDASAYTPYYHVSGFTHPHLPVITSEQPNRIEMFEWGLIPSWIKDRASALSIADKTLNARSETIFEKPSFKRSVLGRRGLLVVDGFIEWRHESTYKQPYLVRDKQGRMLTLGCVWDEWTNRESGELHRTFSIITTPANVLMSYIHNNKQRMPLVITPEQRRLWLAKLDRTHVHTMLRPLPDGELQAEPLSLSISAVAVNTEHPELLTPVSEPITRLP